MSEVVFFGYGANYDINRIRSIIGHEPKGGEGAILKGYSLGIQSLNNIPEKEKSVLKKVWGENFEAYTLVSGTGYINGRLWIISEEDLEKIKKWEFIYKDSWRELLNISITTFDGKTITAVTEKSKDQYGLERVADGLNYDFTLNKEGQRRHPTPEDEAKMELMRQEISRYYTRPSFA